MKVVDELSVMTYVSMLYKRMNKRSSSGKIWPYWVKIGEFCQLLAITCPRTSLNAYFTSLLAHLLITTNLVPRALPFEIWQSPGNEVVITTIFGLALVHTAQKDDK